MGSGKGQQKRINSILRKDNSTPKPLRNLPPDTFQEDVEKALAKANAMVIEYKMPPAMAKHYINDMKFKAISNSIDKYPGDYLGQEEFAPITELHNMTEDEILMKYINPPEYDEELVEEIKENPDDFIF